MANSTDSVNPLLQTRRGSADIYTVYANLTGTPAISLPLFKHTNGMPFGLQVITDKHNELTLLEISNMLLNDYKKY